MDADQLVEALKFIGHAGGLKKSSFFFRWSIFAYPFWQKGNKTGFYVYFYKGVDSHAVRATKMVFNHALTCTTAGLGVGTSGLGALGSNISSVGKFGGIKNAFGVDIGAVQLATVLGSGKSSPKQIASAIIASGKLLMYAVVRVDKISSGRVMIYFRGANRPNSYTEWGVSHIESLEDSSTMFSVHPNGLTMRNSTIIGNWKTGKKANVKL